MEVMFLVICVAGVTAIAATSRGRSGVAWFVLGLLFSVFALIAVLVMPRVPGPLPPPPPRAPEGDDLFPRLRAGRDGRDPLDRPRRGPVLPMIRARGDGRFGQEVAGESSYQPALAAYVRRRDPGGVRIEVDAVLAPEPDNPHDGSAVAVRLGGQLAGYLPAEDAELWVGMLEQRGLRGQSARVRGVIVGGQDIERRGVLVAAQYGLFLDLAPAYDVEDMRGGR